MTSQYLVVEDSVLNISYYSSATGFWRFESCSQYGNGSAFSHKELANFSIQAINLKVGDSIPLIITKDPENAIWSNMDEFSISTNGTSNILLNNGMISATTSGNSIMTFEHKVTGITKQVSVSVQPLLIYRNRSREIMGFIDDGDDEDITPIFPEDLTSHSKTIQEMCSNDTHISLTDFYENIYNTDPEDLLSYDQRISIVTNYAQQALANNSGYSLFESMFSHFLDGTGSEYSSSALTNAVRNHTITINHVNALISLLTGYLSGGDSVSSLYYDEALWTVPLVRKEQTTVYMINKVIKQIPALYRPSFGYDYSNGNGALTLCLDGLVGEKIEITSFVTDDNGYSGIVKFKFYDHFGLDTSDLAEPKYGGMYAGFSPLFKQWYILQHFCDLECDTLPEPFVTIIEFTVPFSGTFN